MALDVDPEQTDQLRIDQPLGDELVEGLQLDLDLPHLAGVRRVEVLGGPGVAGRFRLLDPGLVVRDPGSPAAAVVDHERRRAGMVGDPDPARDDAVLEAIEREICPQQPVVAFLGLEADGRSEFVLDQCGDRGGADVGADVDEGPAAQAVFPEEDLDPADGALQDAELGPRPLDEQRAAHVLVLGVDDEAAGPGVDADVGRVEMGVVEVGASLLGVLNRLLGRGVASGGGVGDGIAGGGPDRRVRLLVAHVLLARALLVSVSAGALPLLPLAVAARLLAGLLAYPLASVLGTLGAWALARAALRPRLVWFGHVLIRRWHPARV